MKIVGKILLLILIIGMASCSKPTSKNKEHKDPFPVKYENNLFSIDMPKGWVCDSSGWQGLESFQNTIDIYDPNGNVVWFHIVKTFMPYKWKNIDEAKEMAMAARAVSGDNVELIDDVDGVSVGGYPTSILYFANYVDNDTIIQKQFVTYLHDSHIVIYFNENFYIKNWKEAQELGDMIIGTIMLKTVKNPLENDSIFKQSIDNGLKNHPVEEKYLKKATELVEKFSKDERT